MGPELTPAEAGDASGHPRTGGRGHAVVSTGLPSDPQRRRARGEGPTRRRRPIGAASALALVTVLGGVVPAEAGDESAAPGYPGQGADWSPGGKDGFGTGIGALDRKGGYTVNDGTLSEVFAPRIDTESSRDTQLVVTDGQTFTDREDQATDHRVELVDPRALVYRQVNTATSGRYRITKTYTTDPARSAVLVDVQFESLDGNPYQVYVLHDAALGLNANDDTGLDRPRFSGQAM